MAYNMSYTTLPTFTQNSIGYNVTQDLSNNSLSSGIPYIFSTIVVPGVYAFSCIFSANLPVNGSLNAELLLNTSSITLCSGTQSNSSGGNTCVTLSQIFSVSSSDSLILTLTQTSTTTPLGCNYSYGVVRIA